MEVLGGPGPRHFLKNEQINVSTVERRILKTAPRALQYGEDAFFTRNTEVRNGRHAEVTIEEEPCLTVLMTIFTF